MIPLLGGMSPRPAIIPLNTTTNHKRLALLQNGPTVFLMATSRYLQPRQPGGRSSAATQQEEKDPNGVYIPGRKGRLDARPRNALYLPGTGPGTGRSGGSASEGPIHRCTPWTTPSVMHTTSVRITRSRLGVMMLSACPARTVSTMAD